MEFNFVEDEDDDEFIDLSDLFPDQDTKGRGTDNQGVSRTTQPEAVDTLQIKDYEVSFGDDVPEARTITDPEVKDRARRSRKRSPSARDYSGKRQAGWSLYCAHREHLPNLCEKEQNRGNINACSCPCHAKRGYVLPEPESVSGSNEQEIVLSIS